MSVNTKLDLFLKIYVDTKKFRESCTDPNCYDHLEDIINITKSKYSVAFI